MQATVYNLSGEQVRTVELDDFIFGIKPNMGVMHQALVRQNANARQGTASTKTRGEVSYTTKKAYRQKGTGNARQGSKGAPHYRHGGVAFGPKPRKYTKEMPRQMRRLAVRSALSVKVAENNLVLIDSFETLEPKTKAMIQALQALNVGTERVLVLIPERSDLIYRASGNLPGVKSLVAQYVNMHDMFKYRKVIMPLAALDILNGFLSQAAQRHNGKKFGGTVAPETSSDTLVDATSQSDVTSFRAGEMADSAQVVTSPMVTMDVPTLVAEPIVTQAEITDVTEPPVIQAETNEAIKSLTETPINLEVPSVSVDTEAESGREVLDAQDVDDNRAI